MKSSMASSSLSLVLVLVLVVVVSLLSTCSLGLEVPSQQLQRGLDPMRMERIVEEVNGDPKAGWKATNGIPWEFFEGKTMSLERMRSDPTRNSVPSSSPPTLETTKNLPTEFDWRLQTPYCVGYIRNQGDCGSCWAFGCAEFLSDRFCIASNASLVVSLSTQELVSCNLDGLEGCRGGDPVTALLYTSVSGLAEEDCVPYTSGNGTSVSCDKLPHDQCTNATYAEPFEKHYSELDSIRWHPDEPSMQAEILANGPIETCFEVYEDFVSYSSGVYQHLTGNALGGHCVKMIGWGVDTSNGTAIPYWTCQNSWGPTWGDNGYFNILRGANECGIEREAFSALPRV